MRRQSLLILLLSAATFVLSAQQPKPPAQRKPETTSHNGKKYTSLLWEISGNGLQKPSYLFGTMHVSDKLVFHLGDPFYNAIRSAQVVALETNPENWQDDYSESVFLKNRNRYGFGNIFLSAGSFSSDKMDIRSFAIENNEEAIKAALAVEPSLVNGLLYRTYGSRMADFEEDTYLDMYIFQTGKKLGKKIAGVENFKESEKLVMEAYRDMYNDQKRKRRSYDFEGRFANPKKLEEAYRNGDLDALDSLDALYVTSDAFQEKFLYKRNEIQAKNIDSIIKKQTLFVAVGAAHLPGKRGVIEMLRAMGYTLKPIKVGEQNSRQKEGIDQKRFLSTFNTQTSDDGFYQVNIPGKKFYKFTEWSGMDIKQYADMANGSYYMVVRVKTNSHFQGQSTETILKKIDSLFYENIPGKILKKTVISKNGFKGWEIVNRIRRGDYQRYNIFVTPFEVIAFKMSGNGEYILHGAEANQFFGSIKFKDYAGASWVNYQPATGGFKIELPHNPSMLRDEANGTSRLEYAAYDQQNSYLVMQNNFYHLNYAEEDSFELKLMNESYAFSSFIDKELSRKLYSQNGYPAMEAKYRHKDGSFSETKFIIRGPLYYSAVVHYKKENDLARKFLASFSIAPFVYPETKTRADSGMCFTVRTPFFKEEKKDEEMERLLNFLTFSRYSDDPDDEDNWPSLFGNYKFKEFGNDTLGEKIFVSYQKPKKYGYIKDSIAFWKNNFTDFDDEEEWLEKYNNDSTFIYKLDKRYEMPGNIKCRDLQMTDTGSSQLIKIRYLYKNGHVFTISTVTDTLSSSPFINEFFTSFTPADTLKGESLFTKKTKQFFNDFFSTDSMISKKAAKQMSEIKFDSSDAHLLKNAIERVNWKTKDYTSTKTNFIDELGYLKDSTITSFLKELYIKVKDTADFQNAILNALLAQRTRASFIAFKDLILQEPPVKDEGNYSRVAVRGIRHFTLPYSIRFDGTSDSYHETWTELYDTMALTKQIFPEFLQLMNIDDYEDDVMELLVTLVDSGYLKAADYESHFSKIYADAKQLLKKQAVREDSDNIEKESRKGRKKTFYYDDEEEEELSDGNEELQNYAILLLPFYDKHPGIAPFFDQLIKTKDRQLFYDICLLLLRNKKAVPDSFFTKFAKLDEYRSELYDDLKKIKQLDKFPAAYKTQEAITRALFYQENTERYEKPDSVVYLEKFPVEYKKKKGWVYFYKYKEERDDNFWQLVSIGAQPEKSDSVDTANDDFTDLQGRKITHDKPIREQILKMLYELVNSQRVSAAGFYDSQGYNLYKNYLSDFVKRERFND